MWDSLSFESFEHTLLCFQSISLIQDLLKEIQDLKESRDDLKKEIKSLQNQLNQVRHTSILANPHSEAGLQIDNIWKPCSSPSLIYSRGSTQCSSLGNPSPSHHPTQWWNIESCRARSTLALVPFLHPSLSVGDMESYRGQQHQRATAYLWQPGLSLTPTIEWG